MNEIIGAYDDGARAKKKWPTKHDNILWYAKDPRRFTFRHADIDRILYMAPGLVSAAKAARLDFAAPEFHGFVANTSGPSRGIRAEEVR